jgi:hypothetical protein
MFALLNTKNNCFTSDLLLSLLFIHINIRAVEQGDVILAGNDRCVDMLSDYASGIIIIIIIITIIADPRGRAI